ELASYKMNLTKRPQIVVANKMDLPEAEANLRRFKEETGIDPIPISAYTRQNLNELLYRIADVLETAEYLPLYEEDEFYEEDLTDDKIKDKHFTITLAPDGVYEISGPLIEEFFLQTNFSQYDSVMRFARRLRQLGVDQALREKGVKDGDTVRINNFEFEFID
ncbi:MAG TPA: Obg family GTPase CgtA, partial [Haloplasmataceae bacterium]